MYLWTLCHRYNYAGSEFGSEETGQLGLAIRNDIVR